MTLTIEEGRGTDLLAPRVEGRTTYLPSLPATRMCDDLAQEQEGHRDRM